MPNELVLSSMSLGRESSLTQVIRVYFNVFLWSIHKPAVFIVCVELFKAGDI